MIIVVGMDNTGKTTLVEGLHKIIKGETIKSPGPIGEIGQKDWVINHIANYEGNDDVIFERFPLLEEMVYGPILRNKSNFMWGDGFFRLLNKANPIIIYCRCSRASIMNWGGREQYSGVIENADKLLAGYDDLYFRLLTKGFKCLVYDYETKDDLNELVGAIRIFQQIKGGFRI